VPEHLRSVFDRIRDEFDRTRAELLAITGEAELLERQPALQRTLSVRNSYLERRAPPRGRCRRRTSRE
jgi:phosphoenolpyruvate carboxylase